MTATSGTCVWLNAARGCRTKVRFVGDEILATLEHDGYATIPDAAEPSQVAAARADLEAILERTPSGRDDFEGHRTQRVYALFAKTRTLDAFAVHPQVLAVLDEVLGHYQLSAPTGISIGAGETAQPLHPDDGIYPLPRPHPELVVNVMWPLEDFTEATGRPASCRAATGGSTSGPARTRLRSRWK